MRNWLRNLINLVIVLMALFGWAVGYWFGKESVANEVIWLPSSPTDLSAPAERTLPVRPVSEAGFQQADLGA